MALEASTAGGRLGRRRRRGLRAGLIALAVVLVLLVVAAIVGDGLFRRAAEQQVARSVEQGLPSNLRGTFTAKIGGPSALWQWAHGSFDDVHLTSRNLTIAGQPASVLVDAHHLPVNGRGALKDVTGRFTVSQAALNRLGPIAGTNATTPKLGDGTVSTTVNETVLGVQIRVAVTLVPSIRGTNVHLTPTKAELKSGGISVPGTTIIRALLPNGVSVCSARYLPPGMKLTTIDTKPGSATFTFAAPSLDLGALQRGETGHC